MDVTNSANDGLLKVPAPSFFRLRHPAELMAAFVYLASLARNSATSLSLNLLIPIIPIYYIRSGLKPHHPVLIIPGFMSTGLKCAEGRWTGERVWLDVAKLLVAGQQESAKNKEASATALPPIGGDASVRAFVAHLALHPPELKDSPEGIRLEPLPGLSGVDFLSNTRFIEGSTYVFGPILDSFRRIGYRDGVDLDAFPYDWRRNVRHLQSPLEPSTEYFAALLARIEQMKAENGGRKVVLVAHSMGCRIVHYFSLWAEQHGLEARVDAAVAKVAALGGPFLGASKGARSLMTGDSMGLPFLSDEESVYLARHLASPPFLLTSLPSAWSTLAPHIFRADMEGHEPAPILVKLESHVDISISSFSFDFGDSEAGTTTTTSNSVEPPHSETVTVLLTFRGKTIHSRNLLVTPFPPPKNSLIAFPKPELFQLAIPDPFICSDEPLRIVVNSHTRGTLGESTLPLSELCTAEPRSVPLLDLHAGMSVVERVRKEAERKVKEEKQMAAMAAKEEKQVAAMAAKEQKKIDKAQRLWQGQMEWEQKEILRIDKILGDERSVREKKYEEAKLAIAQRRESAERNAEAQKKQLLEIHAKEVNLLAQRAKSQKDFNSQKAKLEKLQAKQVLEFDKAVAKDRANWDKKDYKDLVKLDRQFTADESKAAKRGTDLWKEYEKKRAPGRAKIAKDIGGPEAMERVLSMSAESFSSSIERVDSGASVVVQVASSRSLAVEATRETEARDEQVSVSDGSTAVASDAAQSGSPTEHAFPATKEEIRAMAASAAPVVGQVNLVATFFAAGSPEHELASPSEPGTKYVPTRLTDILERDGGTSYSKLINEDYASNPIFGPSGSKLATAAPKALKSWHLVYGTGRRTEIGFVVRRRNARIAYGPEGEAWCRYKLDWGLYGRVGPGLEAQGGIVYENREARQTPVVSPEGTSELIACGDGTVALVSLLHPITWRQKGVEVTTYELPGAEHRGMLGEERLHAHLLSLVGRREEVREVALTQFERARYGLQRALLRFQ